MSDYVRMPGGSEILSITSFLDVDKLAEKFFFLLENKTSIFNIIDVSFHLFGQIP